MYDDITLWIKSAHTEIARAKSKWRKWVGKYIHTGTFVTLAALKQTTVAPYSFRVHVNTASLKSFSVQNFERIFSETKNNGNKKRQQQIYEIANIKAPLRANSCKNGTFDLWKQQKPFWKRQKNCDIWMTELMKHTHSKLHYNHSKLLSLFSQQMQTLMRMKTKGIFPMITKKILTKTKNESKMTHC